VLLVLLLLCALRRRESSAAFHSRYFRPRRPQRREVLGAYPTYGTAGGYEPDAYGYAGRERRDGRRDREPTSPRGKAPREGEPKCCGC
jgi:hypothetical protein